ncbi:hypothetical protein, conserved [Trypanosoma brucei gambiense DAL972]|uniref:Uncharacterized protein n=2 Tax=Trypanosoma brucei TaxID=5691 RepID=Q382S8_TRYB2|nr:hypothetical protein, conserved [Trypanosoma brucei gambiense DAL972]XP_829315.1 hypothetical protein, conserved [Trypanosoma brucei brucei TREU927]EAN80203.1 hypothetical protein, conserved [Trypanosoma brucei brucei TREU927]CBH18281.1 hypothetical protein, conserved [Trypanosoma brucei gambiense DAL972]|eukprot:XP_011780545.1 hypothetical protein, conserved [Trypanosoma brucei gambiense DAL972]
MSTSLVTLASVLASDCTHYAGDPNLLKADRYADRVMKLLQSEQADLLAVRVAIHAQLRDAFRDDSVQKMLRPYLRSDENIADLIEDPKARAKFFMNKQQELQAVVMDSAEQVALRDAHRELAIWERENAVLLRHQMFMPYKPSLALLLESAATIALYRQYATLEEGHCSSDSSSGEVPEQLVKMGGVPLFTLKSEQKPFEVDEHTKMYSQQVLQNKRVEYEEKRGLVARHRKALEECPSLFRLQEFINVRNEIMRKFGIDRLVSLRARRDKALAEPFEGGEDVSTRGLPADNEIVKSRRVAQYSLPKIVQQCHKNYVTIVGGGPSDTEEGGVQVSGAIATKSAAGPLKDLEVFRYWFLACITADAPQIGPNKLVGKTFPTLEEYKKMWQVQKTSYVPSLNTTHRQSFVKNVAEQRGLPHIVVLSPVTYSYMQNNSRDTVVKGELDMIVYDATNEKVLLMVADSHDDRRPRTAFLNAQEERYRFAAVIRAAIVNDNELHDFQCEGVLAEYFFDPDSGSEENYYTIMAPTKISQKVGTKINVPLKALQPFTTCPPRYFILGSNWGVSSGNSKNPHAMSFSHAKLNEEAISLQSHIPEGFIKKNVMPKLLSRKEGLELLENAKRQRIKEQQLQKYQQQQQQQLNSARPAGGAQSTSRLTRSVTNTPRPTSDLEAAAAAELQEEENGILPEEEDPLGPVVPEDVLHPVRDLLLSKRFLQPDFLQRRSKDPEVHQLPATKDGKIRTPLTVFNELIKSRFGEEPPKASPQTLAGRRGSTSNSGIAAQGRASPYTRAASLQSDRLTSRAQRRQ